jgi:hypothetical protein
MAEPVTVTITRESYLEPLGLARHRERLRTEEQERRLYELVVSYLAEQDAVVETPVTADGGAELPFKVPGLPLHIRLSAPTKDELASFVGIAALLLGAASGNLASLSVGAVVAAMGRIQRLHAEYGEVCLVESIAESKRPTQREIVLTLYGKPCRRPTAGCRFHQTETGTCGLRVDAASATIADLTARKVVRQRNVVEPIEYGVVV